MSRIRRLTRADAVKVIKWIARGIITGVTTTLVTYLLHHFFVMS